MQSAAVVKFVPLCKNSKRRIPQWMGSNEKRHMKYKSRMWQRYQESKSYNDWVEYKRAQNKVTREYKKAKKKFEKKLALNIKANPKAFYAFVRSKSMTKEKVGPLKNAGGEMFSDDQEMCHLLNDYFNSVFTNEKLDSGVIEVEQVYKGDHANRLQNIEITNEIVLNVIKKLKNNKAAGVDDLGSTLFKSTAQNICYPLCLIFKASLNEGCVPADWKRANVTAIFKSGPKDNPGNYRPVSLTVQACKIMETLLRDNIVQHLQKFKLVRDSQHGFTKGRSCLTNLLLYLDFVSNYIDKGVPVDAIYLDFRKAFDKVPHKRLLNKVRANGIDGLVANWIEEWLLGREQRVVLNGKSSDWTRVLSGVPQG